jgi:hypothetical protein
MISELTLSIYFTLGIPYDRLYVYLFLDDLEVLFLFRPSGRPLPS